MPGVNSAILGCNISRKTKGIAIFRVPTENGKWSNNWRENVINVATQDCVIDKILKEMIDRKNIYVYDIHIPEEQHLRLKHPSYI